MNIALLVVIAGALLLFLFVRSRGFGGSSGVLDTDGLSRLLAELSGNVHLLDVRTPGEFRSGAIPGSVNVPVDTISEATLPTADRSAKIVVYCLSGARSAQAQRTLRGLGYTDVTNFGAISKWKGELERS
jgi:phage shock protein E